MSTSMVRAAAGALIYITLTLATIFLVKASGAAQSREQQDSASSSSSSSSFPLAYPVCPPDQGRHFSAREELLKRIHRNHGAWGKTHPRWQLLEALHAFDRYQTIAAAEIDRFENLYRHVPKRHKTVGSDPVSHARTESFTLIAHVPVSS
jgi:hypothetical protein